MPREEVTMKQALLVNGNRIVVLKGQTLKWSETGKRLELWQTGGQRLSGKCFRKESALINPV